jgi:tryptophan-rich hypothetical protein
MINKAINKNRPNRKKLLNTKWTAISPENKEKHFVVSKVNINEIDPQVIDSIVLTAVLTNKNYTIDYRELENELIWQQGWQ